LCAALTDLELRTVQQCSDDARRHFEAEWRRRQLARVQAEMKVVLTAALEEAKRSAAAVAAKGEQPCTICMDKSKDTA
jgi:hypothetical protein